MRPSGTGRLYKEAPPSSTGTVVIQERNPTSREQTCVQDAAGNRTCREVVR